MRPDLLKDYLQALKRELWLRGLADADILAEIEEHLAEAVEHELQHGLSRAEAERRAVERFGPVRAIGAAFERERMHMMQRILLVLGLLAGLFLAYVDAQPHWDDTGIVVGGLVLSAGVLTLLGQRRPWLVALAVGAWLPLRYIFFVNHDLRMLIVFLFPLAGAYAGWLVHLLARRSMHPTG